MLYEILANKWRPKNLNELVGQAQATFIIKNFIKNKTIHHSYIISGPQGIGKTSLARILIKSLNCETSITLTPCNNCSCCLSIENNKNIDSIEIDAASKTKVEDIKEIIDLAKYKNSINRFKTFIIDECHMLSQNSFNYLLKILEEPIPNTIYILVTTQIEKIPKTIISRCIDLRLNKLNKKDIKKKLIHILTVEQIEYDDWSLNYISIFSNNSLRQALNIIEKITNFKERNININTTRHLLGILPELSILFIIKSIVDKDIINLLKNIKKITENTLNYKNILIQIQTTLYKILLYKKKIIYDSVIIQYKIFIYLSKKLTENKINIIYLTLIKKQIENIALTDTDFEIILINASISI